MDRSPQELTVRAGLDPAVRVARNAWATRLPGGTPALLRVQDAPIPGLSVCIPLARTARAPEAWRAEAAAHARAVAGQVAERDGLLWLERVLPEASPVALRHGVADLEDGVLGRLPPLPAEDDPDAGSPAWCEAFAVARGGVLLTADGDVVCAGPEGRCRRLGPFPLPRGQAARAWGDDNLLVVRSGRTVVVGGREHGWRDDLVAALRREAQGGADIVVLPDAWADGDGPAAGWDGIHRPRMRPARLPSWLIGGDDEEDEDATDDGGPDEVPENPPEGEAVGSPAWMRWRAMREGRLDRSDNSIRVASVWVNDGGNPGALTVPEGAFGASLRRDSVRVFVRLVRGRPRLMSDDPTHRFVEVLRRWLVEAGVPAASLRVRAPEDRAAERRLSPLDIREDL